MPQSGTMKLPESALDGTGMLPAGKTVTMDIDYFLKHLGSTPGMARSEDLGSELSDEL
jgi:hypothetical protein